MNRPVLLIAAVTLAVTLLPAQFRPARMANTSPKRPTEGSLYRLNDKGEPEAICPLKHTDVKARITGFLARVDVTQEFVNSSTGKIEAVYKFPLPPGAAVDNMRMQIGERTVIGRIKPRDEARAIYDAARAAGHTASLLDQERPNIFTQSVTNIGPGATVKIHISYVETMPYEDGSYSFVFPMVVGPRYIPRDWPQRVPDAANVVPNRTPEGTRAGHDLGLTVSIDAGLPLGDVTSVSHQVNLTRPDARRVEVQLKDMASIPNKDFILKYRVAGDKIQDTLLTHHDSRGGYFTLVLQPPARVAPSEITPKEIVFVIDTSGSMMGFPLEKAKEAMNLAMNSLAPQDTFNLITFSGDEHILFPRPVPATPENLRKAQAFLLSRQGSGGTEMMKAIRAALDPSDQQNHIRIACFMTDGEVGNDMEIIGEVQKHPNARVFAFGIGNSVNRFLLDNMARGGRGEVEYVTLNDDGDAAARRFHERVRNPVLTDISIDWGGLAVTDIYPKRIPDLFSAKPVVVTGRYTSPGSTTVRLRGRVNGRDFERKIQVTLPAVDSRNDVVATLWARAKVDDLMSQDWLGIQRGVSRPDISTAVQQVGLDYRLMTQFTSFVAVEETTIVEGGKPRVIEVPVEMPEGVSYQGIYGREDRPMAELAMHRMMPGSYATGIVGGMPGSANAASARIAQMEQAPVQPPAPASKLSSKLSGKAGIVTVQLWLSDTSEATLAKLKAQGVEVLARPKAGKLVIARVAASKLQVLVAMTEVKYISPA